MAKPVLTEADMTFEAFSRGEGYGSRDALIADMLGLTQIGAVLTEVPPGRSACPCHVHHVEDELFIIIEGEGTYRFGDQSFAVKAGDCLGAPAGGLELAHKLTNTGTTPLRYYAISSKSDMDVCEYPDSGKFMVTSRRASDSRFRYVGREDSALDYWDGEDD